MKLDPHTRGRIEASAMALARSLGSGREPAQQHVFLSRTLHGRPHLKPLQGTGVPGSYRLRVGAYRIALVLLPSERLILLTAVARRTDATYGTLPNRHRRRFHDRA